MNIKTIYFFILVFSISCSGTPTSSSFKGSDGKLSLYNSLDNKSFQFTVSDRFLRKNPRSSQDSDYVIMTKSEVKLLKHLLKKNNYCINSKSKLSFDIASKQEKVYDVTLSGLIEQQYNARSLTPVTYFGKCIS